MPFICKIIYFTTSISKIWQLNMGMIVSKVSLRNLRICSRHFEENQYVGERLLRNASLHVFQRLQRKKSGGSGTTTEAEVLHCKYNLL